MTLREYLDDAGLMPEVEGITGLMDGHRRDELLSRMPTSKLETRLQGALLETLYPLIECGYVSLSFTYPSRVFLVETGVKSEIAFEAEKALEYVSRPEDKEGLTDEYESRLNMIQQGKGDELIFEPDGVD